MPPPFANTHWLACAAVALLIPAGALAAGAKATVGTPADAKSLERGRYIVQITGCNDCHTAGYAQSGGVTPEAGWLTGDSLGFRGAWGTTYPTNLRRYFGELSEDQWVQRARTLTARPPMPWFSVRQLDEADLRAMYRFIRHLGPGGDAAPAFVPPDAEPKPPFIQYPMPPK